jgi:hypothetical protein
MEGIDDAQRLPQRFVVTRLERQRQQRRVREMDERKCSRFGSQLMVRTSSGR